MGDFWKHFGTSQISFDSVPNELWGFVENKSIGTASFNVKTKFNLSITKIIEQCKKTPLNTVRCSQSFGQSRSGYALVRLNYIPKPTSHY